MTEKCLRAKHVAFRNERDGIEREAGERGRIKGVNEARLRISKSRRRRKRELGWGGEGRESIEIYKLLCKLLAGIARHA